MRTHLHKPQSDHLNSNQSLLRRKVMHKALSAAQSVVTFITTFIKNVLSKIKKGASTLQRKTTR